MLRFFLRSFSFLGATHRLVSYYPLHDKNGSLRARDEDDEVELTVPTGCAILCSNQLLEQFQHAHGVNGFCISIVSELKCDTMPAAATQAEIAEAAARQPPLPLAEFLHPWVPEAMFMGDKLNWGHGGGGSRERLVMSLLRGPKRGRGHKRDMSKAAARALVNDMTDEELEE